MPNKRLLVVDDEPELAELIGFIGSGLDFDVEVTDCPETFKRIFETFDPTTIVMDIVMPDISGVDLVQWLAGRGCAANIVVVSGMNSIYGNLLSKIALDGGLAISFLNKPFRIETLREMLQPER